jgi:hypothetical protein
MASALYTDVKRKERTSVFIRPVEGLFGLREWEHCSFDEHHRWGPRWQYRGTGLSCAGRGGGTLAPPAKPLAAIGGPAIGGRPICQG